MPLDESDEDDEDDEYDSDDEYDLAPGEDELGMLDNDDDDDESDELDDLASPRVIDVTEDDVPAPKLVPADAVAQQQQPKGKNKRAAEDSPAAAEKTVNGGGDASKLTKAQKKAQKKLKNNAGAAVDTEQDTSMTESAKAASPAASKGDKKVQFASTLVQGPSSSTSPAASKADKPTGDAAPAAKGKASLGVKTVDGVTIDDKKLGAGPAAKKGDKVSMRYIGKLDADKRVFDCKSSQPIPSPVPQVAQEKGTRALTSSFARSKQKGRALHLQARRRPGHQGLGHWRGRHVGGRRAEGHDPGAPGVRQQEPEGHSCKLDAGV